MQTVLPVSREDDVGDALVEGQLLSRRVEADVVADGHTERDSEAGAKRDGIREAGLLVPVSDAVRVLARVVGVHLMVLGKKLLRERPTHFQM